MFQRKIGKADSNGTFLFAVTLVVYMEINDVQFYLKMS